MLIHPNILPLWLYASFVQIVFAKQGLENM